MSRAVLPSRRPNVSLDLEWQGHALTVTVGFCPATAAPMEVFADTSKGGQMQAALADACVLVSIALQHGIAAEALAKSLSRVPDLMAGGGAELPGSPIGAVVRAVIEARP